jgi:sigma-E factor negative regulatory protein RseA
VQDQHRESLSAWLDGALSRDESRFLARRLETDTELCATLARYALVGSCIRGERVVPVGDSFAKAVHERLAAEATPATRGRHWRPMAGGAIAAGVAVLALMVAGPVGDPTNAPGPTGEAPSVPVLAAQSAYRTEDFAPALPLRQVSETWAMPLASPPGVALVAPLDPAVEAYFLRHSAGASASARAGFVPYVNMVAWPAPRPVGSPTSAQP